MGRVLFSDENGIWIQGVFAPSPFRERLLRSTPVDRLRYVADKYRAYAFGGVDGEPSPLAQKIQAAQEELKERQHKPCRYRFEDDPVAHREEKMKRAADREEMADLPQAVSAAFGNVIDQCEAEIARRVPA